MNKIQDETFRNKEEKKLERQLQKDRHFMKKAILNAEMSTCLRRKVGAVIVKDGFTVSDGYNGAPAGLAHCADLEGGCLRQKLNIPSGQRMDLCRASHAEINSILQCALKHSSPEGGTIYVTTSPCNMCLKAIIQVKIKRIVALELYPDDLSKELLKESGIEFVLMDKDLNYVKDFKL